MSSLRFPLRVVSIALGLALASPAYAADWYVDAVNGSDANTGTSAGAAWQTLTHATAVISSLPLGQWIHVAPGVYDPALGEAFPLNLPPGSRISGTQGSAQTILEGSSTDLLKFGFYPSDNLSSGGGADGLTLRQAGTGITLLVLNSTTREFWDLRIENVGTGLYILGAGSGVHPSFADIWIENASGNAVEVYASGPSPSDGLEPIFDRLQILNCATGMNVHSYTSVGALVGTRAGIVLRDSAIRGSTNDAIRYSANTATSTSASASIRLLRCRIQDSGGNGAHGSAGLGNMSLYLTADATLFAVNQGCGIVTDSGHSQVTLDDCTVADNLVCGVRGAGYPYVTLRNSVLARNGDDLDTDASLLDASFTDCANGDLAGHPNCVAADPMFVNRQARDYRLRFGSPCAESGDPAASAHLDLLGNARTIDGDLDTLAAVDMGAFEFEPLHLLGHPALGQTIAFEFWGQAGGHTTLAFAPAPLMGPQATPFGGFWLDPSLAQNIGTFPVRPGRPFTVRRTLPSNPLLVGRTFSFQALTDSGAAPLGQAYTNAISFVVVP